MITNESQAQEALKSYLSHVFMSEMTASIKEDTEITKDFNEKLFAKINERITQDVQIAGKEVFDYMLAKMEDILKIKK